MAGFAAGEMRSRTDAVGDSGEWEKTSCSVGECGSIKLSDVSDDETPSATRATGPILACWKVEGPWPSRTPGDGGSPQARPKPGVHPSPIVPSIGGWRGADSASN